MPRQEHFQKTIIFVSIYFFYIAFGVLALAGKAKELLPAPLPPLATGKKQQLPLRLTAI